MRNAPLDHPISRELLRGIVNHILSWGNILNTSLVERAWLFSICKLQILELFACVDDYSCDRWNVVTTVILLNVLISLFSSAYEDVGLHFITTKHTQDFSQNLG